MLTHGGLWRLEQRRSIKAAQIQRFLGRVQKAIKITEVVEAVPNRSGFYDPMLDEKPQWCSSQELARKVVEEIRREEHEGDSKDREEDRYEGPAGDMRRRSDRTGAGADRRSEVNKHLDDEAEGQDEGDEHPDVERWYQRLKRLEDGVRAYKTGGLSTVSSRASHGESHKRHGDE